MSFKQIAIVRLGFRVCLDGLRAVWIGSTMHQFTNIAKKSCTPKTRFVSFLYEDQCRLWLSLRISVADDCDICGRKFGFTVPLPGVSSFYNHAYFPWFNCADIWWARKSQSVVHDNYMPRMIFDVYLTYFEQKSYVTYRVDCLLSLLILVILDFSTFRLDVICTYCMYIPINQVYYFFGMIYIWWVSYLRDSTRQRLFVVCVATLCWRIHAVFFE